METNPIRNENHEPHHENVDAARRRLLKLAAYSVPAILTVSFLPVEKVLARPNADDGNTPKTPKTPKTPEPPKSPKTSKPTSPITQTSKITQTLVTKPSAPKATTSSAGSSNYPEAVRIFLELLRELGFLR